MADDVTLPGTGAVIATDDIGSGRQVQLVKPVYGDDSFSTMASLTNPFPVAEQPLVITGTTTSTTTFIASTDVSGYSHFRFSVPQGIAATIVIEMSNDNTNWTTPHFMVSTVPTILGNVSASSSSIILSSSAQYGLGWCVGRYIRVRCTAYTSGTVSMTLSLLKGPSPLTLTFPISSSSGVTSISPSSNNNFTPSDTATNGMFATMSAFKHGYIGGASTQWARERMANIIKSASATASGNTAVWTPSAGRKFRLLKFQLFLTSDATIASGGLLTVKFQDATTDAGISVPVYVPGTGGTLAGGWRSGTVDFGGWGYISSAANNVLNVNLSSALTAGSLGVIACGTEE